MNGFELGEGGVLGEDLMGDGDEYEGSGEMGAARPGFFRRQQGRVLRLPPSPGWRQQVAPGVPLPGEAREPLPLSPLTSGGVFTATVTSIDYEARPQRPFRGSRLVATVARFGASAAGVQPVISGGLIIGTNVQQVQLGDLPLELFRPDAVGVGMKMSPCGPGIAIRAPVRCTGLTSTDTCAVNVIIIGASLA